MQKLSAAATLDQFQQIFLEKYVKPSDSIEARAQSSRRYDVTDSTGLLSLHACR